MRVRVNRLIITIVLRHRILSMRAHALAYNGVHITQYVYTLGPIPKSISYQKGMAWISLWISSFFTNLIPYWRVHFLIDSIYNLHSYIMKLVCTVVCNTSFTQFYFGLRFQHLKKNSKNFYSKLNQSFIYSTVDSTTWLQRPYNLKIPSE